MICICGRSTDFEDEWNTHPHQHHHKGGGGSSKIFWFRLKRKKKPITPKANTKVSRSKSSTKKTKADQSPHAYIPPATPKPSTHVPSTILTPQQISNLSASTYRLQQERGIPIRPLDALPNLKPAPPSSTLPGHSYSAPNSALNTNTTTSPVTGYISDRDRERERTFRRSLSGAYSAPNIAPNIDISTLGYGSVAGGIGQRPPIPSIDLHHSNLNNLPIRPSSASPLLPILSTSTKGSSLSHSNTYPKSQKPTIPPSTKPQSQKGKGKGKQNHSALKPFAASKVAVGPAKKVTFGKDREEAREFGIPVPQPAPTIAQHIQHPPPNHQAQAQRASNRSPSPARPNAQFNSVGSLSSHNPNNNRMGMTPNPSNSNSRFKKSNVNVDANDNVNPGRDLSGRKPKWLLSTRSSNNLTSPSAPPPTPSGVQSSLPKHAFQSSNKSQPQRIVGKKGGQSPKMGPMSMSVQTPLQRTQSPGPRMGGSMHAKGAVVNVRESQFYNQREQIPMVAQAV